MWLSHAVAAALTILYLRHGEASAVRLLEVMGLRIITVPKMSAVIPPAPCRLRTGETTILLPLAELGLPLPVMRHRGPPIGTGTR
ncbi:hypothetical protein GCM10023166_33950 [Paeniglutamicibacter cryotolerans]